MLEGCHQWEVEEDRRTAARTRQLIRSACELLRRQPRPDTFLGRKTQEPFPKQEEKAP
jgi:hypothetical protein